MWTVGRRDHRTYYKAYMDKIKGDGGGGERIGVQLGCSGGMGSKDMQL